MPTLRARNIRPGFAGESDSLASPRLAAFGVIDEILPQDVSPAPFDLTNLVHEVASDGDFEARAQNRRVVVERADACTVSGFEELLRSAIENVVRNAIRHTAEGTAVAITLQVIGSRVLLRVRDYGLGVEENMLAEIFLPFRRAEGGNSEGAGLGLAIASRAVNVHHGRICAINAPEGGLIVEMDLPPAAI